MSNYLECGLPEWLSESIRNYEAGKIVLFGTVCTVSYSLILMWLK